VVLGSWVSLSWTEIGISAISAMTQMTVLMLSVACAFLDTDQRRVVACPRRIEVNNERYVRLADCDRRLCWLKAVCCRFGWLWRLWAV
jgi:hypothetical protein